MIRRIPFTQQEDRDLLEFLYRELRNNNQNAHTPKGLALWDQYVERNPGCKRSADGLSTRFRKNIYDHPWDFGLEPVKLFYILKKLSIIIYPLEKARLEARFDYSLITSVDNTLLSYEPVDGRGSGGRTQRQEVVIEDGDTDDDEEIMILEARIPAGKENRLQVDSVDGQPLLDRRRPHADAPVTVATPTRDRLPKREPRSGSVVNGHLTTPSSSQRSSREERQRSERREESGRNGETQRSGERRERVEGPAKKKPKIDRFLLVDSGESSVFTDPDYPCTQPIGEEDVMQLGIVPRSVNNVPGQRDPAFSPTSTQSSGPYRSQSRASAARREKRRSRESRGSSGSSSTRVPETPSSTSGSRNASQASLASTIPPITANGAQQSQSQSIQFRSQQPSQEVDSSLDALNRFDAEWEGGQYSHLFMPPSQMSSVSVVRETVAATPRTSQESQASSVRVVGEFRGIGANRSIAQDSQTSQRRVNEEGTSQCNMNDTFHSAVSQLVVDGSEVVPDSDANDDSMITIDELSQPQSVNVVEESEAPADKDSFVVPEVPTRVTRSRTRKNSNNDYNEEIPTRAPVRMSMTTTLSVSVHPKRAAASAPRETAKTAEAEPMDVGNDDVQVVEEEEDNGSTVDKNRSKNQASNQSNVQEAAGGREARGVNETSLATASSTVETSAAIEQQLRDADLNEARSVSVPEWARPIPVEERKEWSSEINRNAGLRMMSKECRGMMPEIDSESWRELLDAVRDGERDCYTTATSSREYRANLKSVIGWLQMEGTKLRSFEEDQMVPPVELEKVIGDAPAELQLVAPVINRPWHTVGGQLLRKIHVTKCTAALDGVPKAVAHTCVPSFLNLESAAYGASGSKDAYEAEMDQMCARLTRLKDEYGDDVRK